jgi:hypothetical protein
MRHRTEFSGPGFVHPCLDLCLIGFHVFWCSEQYVVAAFIFLVLRNVKSIFKALFAKLRKADISLIMSVRPSVRMEQLDSHYYAPLIHCVVSVTTGQYPLLKRVLHPVRSSASHFNLQYPLFSLRSFSSCLRLLRRRRPVTSIFPSITCFRRLLLRRCDQSVSRLSVLLYGKWFSILIFFSRDLPNWSTSSHCVQSVI